MIIFLSNKSVIKNMFEVEIKVKILDPEELRQKIRTLNGVYKTSLFHEDTYFNMPKGLRNFTITDEALRLRKSEEFIENSIEMAHKSSYFLTYKGNKLDLSTKTREEIEVKVNNFEKMDKILNVLGFQEVLTIQKERELYEITYLDKKIDLLVDYIPKLQGFYMELEMVVNTHEEIDDARDFLFDFLESLDISAKNSIRKSYLELIIEQEKEQK
jgi:adenylate cyclase class 2